MSISKRLRYEILRRDNHACRYCGATAPGATLQIDHVVAAALGGTDEPSNLVTACRDCNSGKSATPAGAPLVEDVAQDAARWAAAVRRVNEQASVQREERIAVEQGIWSILGAYQVPSYRGGGTLADYLPGDWFASLEQFLAAGLSDGDITDAVCIAAEKPKVRAEDVWRYACGVCHNIIRKRQDAARAIFDAEIAVQDVADLTPCAGDHPRITPEVRYAAGLYSRLAAVCDGF